MKPVNQLAVKISQTSPASYSQVCDFLRELDAWGFDYSKLDPKEVMKAGGAFLTALSISKGKSFADILERYTGPRGGGTPDEMIKAIIKENLK